MKQGRPQQLDLQDVFRHHIDLEQEPIPV
jgi:hypothetical protein